MDINYLLATQASSDIPPLTACAEYGLRLSPYGQVRSSLPVLVLGDGVAGFLSRAHAGVATRGGTVSTTSLQKLTYWLDGQTQLDRKYRITSKRQPLYRAIGMAGKKGVRIADLCGGFGSDAALFAYWGCSVSLFEHNPAIAFAHSMCAPRLLSQPAWQTTYGNCLSYIHDLAYSHEVFYLDPMYPQSGGSRGRKSLSRGPAQLLQALCQAGNGGMDGDSDGAELLTACIATGVKRIVVKRPVRARPLGMRAPTWSCQGNTTRYDVYIR